MGKIKIAYKGMPVYQDCVYKGIFTRDIYQGDLVLSTDFQYADGTYPEKGTIIPHFVIDSLNPHNCKQDSNMETREILAERESVYGDFRCVAECSQDLKKVIGDHAQVLLKAHQKESLDMICNKIARIICGDPEYKDSWADIAGYATLSADRCTK